MPPIDLVAMERFGNAGYDRERVLAGLAEYECEEIDGSRLTDKARKALIKDARSFSMREHVIVGNVFGSNQHPWTESARPYPRYSSTTLLRGSQYASGYTRTRLLMGTFTPFRRKVSITVAEYVA